MLQAVALVALATQASAFPFVADLPGVRRDLLPRRGEQQQYQQRRDADTCPFNPDHEPAAPLTAEYPYLGAVNGGQGTGKGGIRVPALGDTAHYFTPPGPLDIRGPCPGLNVLANHNFLAHDGITTYNELVDAQQNVYNIGYDLANLLASFGVGLDGDTKTEKLSIGCAADSRTNSAPGVAGYETGLDGHNKFEADASLTRDDYFLAGGDDHSLNTTLFQLMADTCRNNFDRNNMAYYRYLRYQRSRATNPDFFFGPGSLLLYGAATFLYRAFPPYGGAGAPTLAVQQSFFGVGGTSGNFSDNHSERIPDSVNGMDGWYNAVEPYDMNAIGGELFSMYGLYPVQFGANVGQAGNFDGMNYTQYISGGFFRESSAQNMLCLLYQMPTSGFPTSLSNVYQLPADALAWVLGKIEPAYSNLGCPSPLYPESGTPAVGGGGSSSSGSSSTKA